MKTRYLALAFLALVITGCTIKFRGQPLLGVDPNGTLTYGHPEVTGTNTVIVPHD